MNNRNMTVDYIKGICCIAVVFIHYTLPGQLGESLKAISRFAVPYFFFVSGYFLFHNDLVIHKELIFHKIKNIGIITLKAIIFYAIFTVIFNYLSNTAWSLIDFIYSRYQIPSIIRFFITNDPFVYAHLWYLFALIYCYLFIALFDNRRFSKKLIIVIVLLLCVFSILSEFKTILNISSSILIPNSEKRVYLFNLFILRALPFVLLGGYLRTYGSIPNNSRNSIRYS